MSRSRRWQRSSIFGATTHNPEPCWPTNSPEPWNGPASIHDGFPGVSCGISRSLLEMGVIAVRRLLVHQLSKRSCRQVDPAFLTRCRAQIRGP